MVKFDFTKTPITQIADYIILAASKSNASDIHFDPREDGMIVRFRIDGDLQNYTQIPKTYERNLATRLKLLANMNITETRLPQDGAIKGKFGEVFLDMRVSCLPLNEGEKIVVRILDYSRSLEGLDQLGFNEKNLNKLKRMIRVPNGIILITGATGSGKSTTVYSILQKLNKEERNIITVEDPIEMSIEGLNQVQVNSEIGMTFATALRSILRQDPNVILIGEIRDSETAQIAVRASITGHLVLSTIHTNNALSTVERLLDMNVERYLLSSALTGIISQRLAKKVCKKCHIERETTPYEKKLLKLYLDKEIDKVWDANPDGCDECHNGYKGRIAVQEVLELDDDMRNALNNENLKKEDLRDLVYTQNVITMLQDALGKVIDGITSFDEVYRIIEIEDAEALYEETDKNNLYDSNKNSKTSSKKVKKVNTKLVIPTFKKDDKTRIVAPNTNSVQDATQTNQIVVPTTQPVQIPVNSKPSQGPINDVTPIQVTPIPSQNVVKQTVPPNTNTQPTTPMPINQNVVTPVSSNSQQQINYPKLDEQIEKPVNQDSVQISIPIIDNKNSTQN